MQQAHPTGLLTHEDAKQRFTSFWQVLNQRPELYRKWKEQSDPRWNPIATDVPGYSTELHYSFFQGLLHLFPLRRILVVGVAKFSDDWPEENRTMGWEAAGYGPPPTLQNAQNNIRRHQSCPVELIQSDDLQFLAQCNEQFDFIYLDTAHDYETVAKQLELCQPLLSPGGLIGGDDLMNDWIWLAHCSQYRSAVRSQVA